MEKFRNSFMSILDEPQVGCHNIATREENIAKVDTAVCVSRQVVFLS